MDSDLRFSDGMRPESEVRNRLRAGGSGIRTSGPATKVRRFEAESATNCSWPLGVDGADCVVNAREQCAAETKATNPPTAISVLFVEPPASSSDYRLLVRPSSLLTGRRPTSEIWGSRVALGSVGDYRRSVPVTTVSTLRDPHCPRRRRQTFARTADPIGSGLVLSLARPGGNLTGLSDQMAETGAAKGARAALRSALQVSHAVRNSSRCRACVSRSAAQCFRKSSRNLPVSWSR